MAKGAKLYFSSQLPDMYSTQRAVCSQQALAGGVEEFSYCTTVGFYSAMSIHTTQLLSTAAARCSQAE